MWTKKSPSIIAFEALRHHTVNFVPAVLSVSTFAVQTKKAVVVLVVRGVTKIWKLFPNGWAGEKVKE